MIEAVGEIENSKPIFTQVEGAYNIVVILVASASVKIRMVEHQKNQIFIILAA